MIDMIISDFLHIQQFRLLFYSDIKVREIPNVKEKSEFYKFDIKKKIY